MFIAGKCTHIPMYKAVEPLSVCKLIFIDFSLKNTSTSSEKPS